MRADDVHTRTGTFADELGLNHGWLKVLGQSVILLIIQRRERKHRHSSDTPSLHIVCSLIESLPLIDIGIVEKLRSIRRSARQLVKVRNVIRKCVQTGKDTPGKK